MKQTTFEERLQILHSPFDIDVHKETFIAYCEAIIWPDGTIEYAVPSHADKLMQIYADKHGMTMDEVKDMLRQSKCNPYYRDIMEELGIIFVWYESMYAASSITKQQMQSIRRLLKEQIVSDKVLRDMIFI